MSTGSPASHSLLSRSHDALTPTRSLAEFFSDLAGSLLAGYIDRGLDRTSYAIVTNNGRIKNFVVSLEHFAELAADGVG